MIPALETTVDDLSKISAEELQVIYCNYKNCIELIEDKRLCVGDKSESDIRMQFNRIKQECESRFHVSKFPMSS